MKLLLQQVRLFEPTSEFHLQICDVLIRDYIIQDIQSSLSTENTEIIDATNCWLSIGWMDVGVQIGEPGFEHREDLQTVTAAAAAGGFTAIACFPNTYPVIQTKSDVRYLRKYSTTNLVDLFPIGAATMEANGVDLTEMYDMHHAGAIAFSDGKTSIQNAGVLLRVLQYVKAFDGIVINHPQDKNIVEDGQMHEGKVSTQLGLKGIPSLSEELMLQRDIELLDYSNSRLHVHNISTAESVRLIRRAKERGLKITASVTALNLALTEDALTNFDTNSKVQPPLREKDDRIALLEGITDGVIDFITSNHVPLEKEVKFLEFPYAKFGAIGLETAFSVSQTALSHKLPMEKCIAQWSYHARKIFNLDIPKIAIGEKANLTLFDPDISWQVEEKTLHSKSKNSPFLGKVLKGKTILTVNNGQIWRNKP